MDSQLAGHGWGPDRGSVLNLPVLIIEVGSFFQKKIGLGCILVSAFDLNHTTKSESLEFGLVTFLASVLWIVA